MGRITRVDVGDTVYHVLNRANNRTNLFSKAKHYQSFLEVIREALEFVPMRILSYCLMPNHWHFILYPRKDGDLSKFIQRVTLTHTQRYRAQTQTIGHGHVYQGRYKSFPVQHNEYFLNLVRYVERNAKRAALVKRAEYWPWSSLAVRSGGSEEQKKLLSPWPMKIPADYITWVNESQPKEEIENIKYAIKRNKPLGEERWISKIVKKFGLENTLRNPGRPSKNGT